MYLNVFSDINCWLGDSCLSNAAINLLHCLNLHPCTRSTMNCTKIPPLFLCCWFSKQLPDSVNNCPVRWLFTVRFFVTAESIECGRLFKSQNLAVFSNTERDSWSRTSYEVPEKYCQLWNYSALRPQTNHIFFFKYNNSATLTLWLLFSDSLSNAKRHITQPINQTVTVT